MGLAREAQPQDATGDAAAAGEEVVGRTQDAVDGGLASAVAVVEEVLGLGLVDGHHGEGKGVIGGHGLEADDTGGRLFGAGQDLGQLLGLQDPGHLYMRCISCGLVR